MPCASVINIRNWKRNKTKQKKNPTQTQVVLVLFLFCLIDPVQVEMSKTFLKNEIPDIAHPVVELQLSDFYLHLSRDSTCQWGEPEVCGLLERLQSDTLCCSHYSKAYFSGVQCPRFQIRKHIPESLTEIQHNITLPGITLLPHLSPWSWGKNVCINWYMPIYTIHTAKAVFWLTSTGQVKKVACLHLTNLWMMMYRTHLQFHLAESGLRHDRLSWIKNELDFWNNIPRTLN